MDNKENKEYIIKNCTKEETNILLNSNINCYPDDIFSNDICIYGTIKDVEKALKLIKRS